MNYTIIPEGYHSPLTLYETQAAISLIKRVFQDSLSRALNLKRVSAPLFVDPATGLNDNLSGVERPVGFDIPAAGIDAQVVQSLAKWKRLALYRYDVHPGKGIYADMNAIRRDESLDNLHSIYVDQWDWERVITPETRTVHMLKETVRDIVRCIHDASLLVNGRYPQLKTQLSDDVSFVTSQELLDLYPNLSSKERENAYVREHPITFLLNIGDTLSNGEPHDGRAPDYDDWNMNGDLLFHNPVLDCSFEISSMGIRVDSATLDKQLTAAHCDDRRTLLFHRMLLQDELPLTMGGGIGQSRLCMLLLGKAHIGEVQSSIWDEETHRACKDAGIVLL